MNILALDACGRYAITALTSGDAPPLYAAGVTGAGAVRSVYSSIDLVLANGKLAPKQLDAIVVNTGPGSWTGTRIAVTYAGALSFAATARVFGFSGFAIGEAYAGEAGVSFIDQLGKTVSSAQGDATPTVIDLFPEISADDYLASRLTWLDRMILLGADALAEGAAGDPVALQTTYFQEFLSGARS